MNLDYNKIKWKGVEYLLFYVLKLKDFFGKLFFVIFIS